MILTILTGIFKNLDKKLKSPVFLVAILLFAIEQLNIPENIISNEQSASIVSVIINILTGLGLLNNPENNLFVRKGNDDISNFRDWNR